MDVPMELTRILISEMGDQQVIVLREKDGERTFPIMIGISEAIAIDRRLKDRHTPRPMTHDLLANVIGDLGGQVEKIVISDLREHTFIATLYIRQDGRLIEVDSRPSDAIALGVAGNTPIYVADHVLDEVLHQPATPEERIELLRQRMMMLGDRIIELTNQLNDEEFLAGIPETMLDDQRRQLEEMKNEYDAIRRVLKKFS